MERGIREGRGEEQRRIEDRRGGRERGSGSNGAREWNKGGRVGERERATGRGGKGRGNGREKEKRWGGGRERREGWGEGKEGRGRGRGRTGGREGERAMIKGKCCRGGGKSVPAGLPTRIYRRRRPAGSAAALI